MSKQITAQYGLETLAGGVAAVQNTLAWVCGPEGSVGDAKRQVPSQTSEPQDRVTELIEQQTAISEVLRAIANSPHDLQPIFDAILDSATRLCRADIRQLTSFRRERPSSRGYARRPPFGCPKGQHSPWFKTRGASESMSRKQVTQPTSPT